MENPFKKPQPKHSIKAVLIACILCGCSTYQEAAGLKLITSQEYRTAAKALVKDYMNAMQNGESLKRLTADYGSDLVKLRDVGSYRIEDEFRTLGLGDYRPLLVVVVKGGWALTVPSDKPDTVTPSIPVSAILNIWFRYDPKIDARGDKYRGLRIDIVKVVEPWDR